MRSKTIAALMLGIAVGSALCQSPPANNPGPVEAELLKPLNIRRLTVGSVLFLRVTRDWNGLGCSLRQGSTLEATVELAELHKGQGASKLALAFNSAQCGGPEMKPMNLLLAAVAEVTGNWQTDLNMMFRMPSTPSFNPRSGGMGTTPASGIDFSSMTPSLTMTSVNHHFPMSAKVQPGDVIGIKGMKLDLGTGPKQSSVISTRGRDVTLDAFTQFLLVPSALVFARVDLALHASADSASLSVLAGPNPVSSAVEAPNDIEACAPPGCAVDLPVTAHELAGPSGMSIAVRPLGYAPRPSMKLEDFTDDDVLAWVGQRQLLFAFNSHRLIRREGVASTNAARRIIRAVLLDTQSRTIIRAVDWETTDMGRYLWPLARHRILVHVGNELRVYGADLEVEQTVPLAGPLAFVRIAPNDELLAVATLRERHSPELHAKIRDEFFEEPQEDVDVSILDRDFKVIAQASTVSDLQPPTMLNEGQAVLLAQPNNRYRIALSSWSGKKTTLAHFASLCTPEISSVAPDLLFLLSCSTASDHAEYRVIRTDGKLLMHAEAGPREVGQEIAGSELEAMFAVKVVHTSRDLSRGMEFNGSDFESEELRVYSASNGKRLFVARVDGPTTSRGGFALSPDGTQLAVLTYSEIQFFSLPAQ